jgi:hypothetical protein
VTLHAQFSSTIFSSEDQTFGVMAARDVKRSMSDRNDLQPSQLTQIFLNSGYATDLVGSPRTEFLAVGVPSRRRGILRIEPTIYNRHEQLVEKLASIEHRTTCCAGAPRSVQVSLVMTMGTLVKTLTRLTPLFPEIQPVFDAAEHLQKEGLYLRNMMEHADINLAAANKGKPRGGFLRKSNLLPELPGSSGGTADATALIVDQDGHWLGGRLNVERVVAEVRPIYEAAQAILPPQS